MKMTKSIQFRLISLIGILVICTLLAVSGASYYFSEKYLENSLNQTEQALSGAAANHVKSEIIAAMIQLEDLASEPRVMSGDKEQMLPAMKDAHQRLGKFDHIFYAPADGISLSEAGDVTKVNDRDYFQKVTQTSSSYISDPFTSRATNKTSIAIAVPVKRSGQLIGVLWGTYSLEKLMPLIKDVKFKEKGYAALLDHSGVYLAHPTRPELMGNMNIKTGEISEALKSKLGGNVSLDPKLMAAFTRALETGGRVPVEYKATNGAAQIGSFTPLELPGGQRWFILMTTTKDDATSEITTLAKTQIGLSVLCLVIVIMIIFRQSKSFVRPILKISQDVRAIAAGQLKPITKTIQDSGELGQLADNIIAMNESLRKLVQQVQAQSHQLAASSEQLTANAHQSADVANQVAGSVTEISRRAEQQAASSSQLRSVAQTMADKVKQISDAAQGVSDIAGTTSQSAEQGSQKADQTITQMNMVGQGAAAAQTSITDLNNSFQEIREIVTLISSIAGQTNLLALNAAIEAARAGEHGRGFAVVAEEVRKLAEESNQAAQKIGGLIEKNQVNMEQVVNATQASAGGIQTGITLVKDTGETFKSIVTAILQLSDQIRDISLSINHITAGNQTLLESIQEIDGASKASASESMNVSAATEEQSASMEEIASSSQSLAMLAADLQKAIEKYQL